MQLIDFRQSKTSELVRRDTKHLTCSESMINQRII